MATTVVKRMLSGSTDGLPINVSATAGGVTTLHLGPTGTSVIDELWVYATNSSTNAVTVSLEWGASGSQVVKFDVAPRAGHELVVPGVPLQGRTAAGTTISVLASSSNVIGLYGFVNRITQT